MENTSRTIHHVLSYSYTTFFFGLIFGLIVHTFFPISIFPDDSFSGIGFLLVVLGSFFIYWAQHTTQISAEKRHSGDITPDDFKKGPYRFSRSPTHIGLVLLSFGVGVIMNSLVMVFVSIISFIVSHSCFLNQQDKMLESKYGEPYKEYKKTVSRWI